MNKNLHNYRKSYEQGALTLASVDKDPFIQFNNWFHAAETSKNVFEVNAMTLSTIGVDGFPRGRVVLLKEYNTEGFIFYTNYESEKGKAMAKTPEVCLSFFWPALEQQILIKGVAEKVSEEMSIQYFSERPRKSQLGAMVSDQSESIESREALEAKLAALEQQFDGQDIPKPKNWGGYLVRPTLFEFWQGRRSRLHDRIQYAQEGTTWNITRLQP